MKVNDYFDKVYLINLDRRKDRMERMEKRLSSLGIEYDRVPAIDATQNGITANQALIETNINIFAISVYKKFKKILVLEDDCLFHKDFLELFSLQVKKVPDYDIWGLGAIVPNPEKFNYITEDHFTDLHCIYGTHAIAYNVSYLTTLTKELETLNNIPIDIVIGERIKCEKWSSIKPMLCVQDHSQSDIVTSSKSAREIDTEIYLEP